MFAGQDIMKKTVTLLVAAAALAGCASTSPMNAAPGNPAASSDSPVADRCMWMKPRCRVR
ncbi:MAG: hypothetical protein CL820_05760 [Croceicoccus sp.]|jgi:uncharacterized lipoprotein YajG|nr:hypothetical protein [Croceicoccus sp.]MAL25394.1 hypothetical protein [Croceicoccus sp.]